MNDQIPDFNLNFPTEPAAPEPQPPKRQKPKPQKPKPQKAAPKKRGPKPGFKRKARAVAPVGRPVKAVAAALDLEEADWKIIKYLAELPAERRNMVILIANQMSR